MLLVNREQTFSRLKQKTGRKRLDSICKADWYDQSATFEYVNCTVIDWLGSNE